MSDHKPLMQKATAVWLVDNTALTFEQIAEFCQMHILEVKGIADGDVAGGVRGKSPVTSGELTREEISEGEKDPNHSLRLTVSKVKLPEIKAKKRPRYTPVSRRQDRPNAIIWLLRSHPELKDSQIIRLVGTTKPTIQQIRDRTHWNTANLVPQDPVTLSLCAQVDLDAEVNKASKRVAKERAAAGLPPEPTGTLLPTSVTTGYDPIGGASPEYDPSKIVRTAPTADEVFANAPAAKPDIEEADNQDETARVLAKLNEMSAGSDAAVDVDDANAEDADAAGETADDTEKNV